MFNDMKKGFSYSIGRFISRLFIIAVIVFILFCIGVVKSKAAVLEPNVQPDRIYSNNQGGGSEEFNKYYNGIFYEPRDSGNVLVYFNTSYDLVHTSGLPMSHVYAVQNVDNYFGKSLTGFKEVHYSLYYYMYNVNEMNDSITLNTSNSALLSDLVGYSSGLRVDVNDGAKSYVPIYEGYEYIGNGGFRFKYKIQTDGFSNMYIKSAPWGSNRGHVYTIGINIDSINDWSGVLDVNVLNNTINNQTTSINANNDKNTQIIKSEVSGLPGKIANAVWGVFSGGFNAITGWLDDIFDSIKDIMSNDEPTSTYISNYIQSFPLFDSNIVAQFVTLPIHILGSLTGTSCIPISLGSLFGTNLTIPCLGSVIYGILGTIYSIISWMITFFIYYKLLQNMKDTFMSMLVLDANVASKFKIKL